MPLGYLSLNRNSLQLWQGLGKAYILVTRLVTLVMIVGNNAACHLRLFRCYVDEAFDSLEASTLNELFFRSARLRLDLEKNLSHYYSKKYYFVVKKHEAESFGAVFLGRPFWRQRSYFVVQKRSVVRVTLP